MFKWIDFTISNVVVTKGVKYWILLYPTSINYITTGVFLWGYNNGYVNGEAGWGTRENTSNGWKISAMTPDSSKDLLFKTYVSMGKAEITYTPTQDGEHVIYAWVDAENKIAEIDERNNLAAAFLFTDPTFIVPNRKDLKAFREFLGMGVQP